MPGYRTAAGHSGAHRLAQGAVPAPCKQRPQHSGRALGQRQRPAPHPRGPAGASEGIRQLLPSQCRLRGQPLHPAGKLARSVRLCPPGARPDLHPLLHRKPRGRPHLHPGADQKSGAGPDGRGDPIKLTIPQYFQRYVYDKDYTQATEIGIDRIITGGNALENLAEAYPGCRFVDFAFPSADPVNDGLDWSSLKLVFQPGEFRWLLVGVVHGEWTI